MIFDDYQKSRFIGQPVRLFIFERGGVTLRFCKGPKDFQVGADTYTASQMDRSAIEESLEREKAKITIQFPFLRNESALEIPTTQALGEWWFPFIPSGDVKVTCLTTHVGATDAPKQDWTGFVVGPEFGDTTLKLTCLPGPTRTQSINQGPKVGRACWKTPYSQGPRGCGMQLEDFEIASTAITVSGLTLTADEFAAAPLDLTGGWFEWTRTDGLIEERTILAHLGDSITLQWGAVDLADVTAGSAWPTCPQTWDGCSKRFDDPENHYGGAIYLPIADPLQDSMSWG